MRGDLRTLLILVFGLLSHSRGICGCLVDRLTWEKTEGTRVQLLKNGISEREARDVTRARHFHEPIEPAEWENKHPYTDPHIYFGPGNSFIGTLMKDLSPKQRMEFMPVLYRAIVRELNKATINPAHGHYEDLRTLAQSNLDLIQAIRTEAAAANWPR